MLENGHVLTAWKKIVISMLTVRVVMLQHIRTFMQISYSIVLCHLGKTIGLLCRQSHLQFRILLILTRFHFILRDYHIAVPSKNAVCANIK